MSEIQHVGDLDDARPLRSLCRRRVALAHVGLKRWLGFVALMGAESGCDLPTGVQYDPSGRTILALSAPFSTAVIGAREIADVFADDGVDALHPGEESRRDQHFRI